MTIRRAAFDIDAALARWDAAPALAAGGVGFLTHGWADAVVDGHYQTVRQLEDLATSSGRLCSSPGATSTSLDEESSCARVPAACAGSPWPCGRWSGVSAGRRRTSPCSARDRSLFQDVYDHVLGAAETVCGTRDHVSGILETNATEQDNELDIITRKLAAWAAIIAVPTAITGRYGQNALLRVLTAVGSRPARC
ncbi:hypothetical protein LWC35_24300 [Pseudonocardia kujensis]|uniref:CorA family divalent cation transporter n=1 Tax=Pseudonocardia kujensis TaxID=1128675 RepID=UPI001E5B6911|nr:CorA family divalent cation transporter [Pseudonocardia kujensis]MCE0766001.1 hypothetical protein [Pseudonocardia kujensis]